MVEWVVLWAAALGAALCLALLVVTSNRGLDVTDEGLMLLAADPPSDRSLWAIPFGWHTAPLFRAVGYDIAAFRAAGTMIVFGLGAVLGATVVRHTIGRGRLSGADVVRGCVVGSTGSLLLYGGLLRAPGYNWVNLTGLLLAAIGLLLIAEPAGSAWRRWGFVVASFGMFWTLPGKPSSAPMMLLAGLLFLAHRRELQAAVRDAATVALGIVAWVALAVGSGLWPSAAPSVVADVVRWPALDPAQSVTGAAFQLLRLPLTVLEYGIVDAPEVGLPVGAACCLLLVARLWSTARLPLRQVAVGLLVIAFLMAVVASARQPAATARWFASGNVTAACTILVLLALGWRSQQVQAVAGPGAVAPRARSASAAAALLVATAVIFGFGSGNGLFRQVSLAGGCLLLAALAVSHQVGGRRRRHAAPNVVTALALGLVVVALLGSVAGPYRMEPIADQTVAVEVGPRGASLRLDQDLAALLTILQDRAAGEGFAPGTRLVGLGWRWSSTIPYHLGAEVPETLMVTLFGYPGSVDLAEVNLRRLGPDWADAWVLASDGAELNDAAVASVGQVAELLEREVGRRFPDAYICVVQHASVQLWRPAHPGEPSDRTCPPDAGLGNRYRLTDGAWS